MVEMRPHGAGHVFKRHFIVEHRPEDGCFLSFDFLVRKIPRLEPIILLVLATLVVVLIGRPEFFDEDEETSFLEVLGHKLDLLRSVRRVQRHAPDVLGQRILLGDAAVTNDAGRPRRLGEALLPFAGMKRAHVKEFRDTRADAPGAANNITKAISAMFAWAKDAEIVDVNPANGIKRLTTGDGEGFHTWEVSEIVQYENQHPRGTMARMALAIFMFTGLRLSDAAIFGRQHITEVHNRNTGNWEKWIRIKPGKTDKSKVRSQPVVVELPLLPELEAELSCAPVGNLTFLVTEYGRPFSEHGLGNKMRQWCDEAGLPNCSAHGVRKAGATVAAENGATHEQLKAIYGWTTYQQPDHYIRKARRRIVAQSARTLLVYDRNENENVPLFDGVEEGGTKKTKKSS